MTEPGDAQDPAAAAPVVLSDVAGSGGVVWSASPAGVHVNLVVLDPGGSIAAHRGELDVLFVIVQGDGTLTVDGTPAAVSSSTALLVPSGATRAVDAGAEGLRYLTIHAQRGPLSISPRPQPRGH
jgi:quercetin dioxygenase-like cupin family protein